MYVVFSNNVSANVAVNRFIDSSFCFGSLDFFADHQGIVILMRPTATQLVAAISSLVSNVSDSESGTWEQAPRSRRRQRRSAAPQEFFMMTPADPNVESTPPQQNPTSIGGSRLHIVL